MNDKIIKSSVNKKRNPLVSFLLSFFFTGSGEIYNGEFSKGVILFSIKNISILLFPLLVFIKAADSYLYLFLFLVFTALSLHILSPFLAAYLSVKNKKYPLKKYNNIFFYITYIILNSAITAFSFYTIYTSAGISVIGNNDNLPSMIKGDIILTLKYNPHKINKGEMVLTGKENFARIIALENENFRIIKDNILIDNFALDREILSETDLKKYSIEFGEKVVFEINNRKKYPVISDRNLLSEASIKETTVKNKNILTAKDNRSVKNQFEEITADKIRSRVEGIIYSSSRKRILSLPFESKMRS